ncbi:permease [Betaproteobacteria bacterium SCGC AG-212-J23]|nr:permease [Betaproteobacteria bacterium SCGC AG-212-J23]
MNGVVAALLSSALGGTAGALTRYVIGATDPMTLAAYRFGIGFLLIFPLAFLLRSKFPKGKDAIWVALLGVLFFSIFFVFYNLALSFTTAARGSLALSCLPLTTMFMALLFKKEQFTGRKVAGIFTAIGGVAAALWTGLADAPPGAWRGDLIMAGATVCMALYNVWSRPLMQRSSMLGFLALGMGFGAAASVSFAIGSGGLLHSFVSFNRGEWIAAVCIGVFGGAAAFYLWVYALERTTPTRVANTMTINPIAASLLAAALVGEPLGWNLLLGIGGVGTGIWLASTEGRK